MNLAFGGKLIWRLLDSQTAWWKKVLEIKYLNQSRLHILILEIPNRHCTKIWKLCKKAITFMALNVSKVRKGGETVNLGSDKIMGSPPINSLPGMGHIIHYLQSKGIYNLSQISQWNVSSNTWVRWEFPPIPHHLKVSFDSLCNYLHSIAPTIKGEKDEFRWDPSGANYSIKAGYSYLNNMEHPTVVWAHWKILKRSQAIPKIKFFMWTLLHGKLLTAENLRKRGIVGPSRCPNCQAAKESIQHLFISCPFAALCWNSIVPFAPPIWNPQHSMDAALNNWRRNYPWQSSKQNPAKIVWNATPFALLWRIWIAWNNRIFWDKTTTIRHILIKISSLASENIASKITKKIDLISLWAEERNFIGNLIDRTSSMSTTKISKFRSKVDNPEWKIRLTKDEFSKWILSKKSHSLFFDGASKSNPGAAGAGGIILDPTGASVSSFEWGLGNLTNNRAEALGLYQGLLQLQKHGISKALIFGDSTIIISLMNSKRQASNIFLHQIISQCKNLLSQDWEYHFFHVLHSNNQEADKRASQACSREKGNLRCNHASLHQFIPWFSWLLQIPWLTCLPHFTFLQWIAPLPPRTLIESITHSIPPATNLCLHNRTSLIKTLKQQIGFQIAEHVIAPTPSLWFGPLCGSVFPLFITSPSLLIFTECLPSALMPLPPSLWISRAPIFFSGFPWSASLSPIQPSKLLVPSILLLFSAAAFLFQF